VPGKQTVWIDTCIGDSSRSFVNVLYASKYGSTSSCERIIRSRYCKKVTTPRIKCRDLKFETHYDWGKKCAFTLNKIIK